MKKEPKEKHPETKEGEIFLGHMTGEFFRNNVGWKTKRAGGAVRNDPYGRFSSEEQGEDITFPVFVQRKEILEEIARVKKEGLSTEGLEKLLE